MTELRRSSRVRQSAKHTPQYYEQDEKKRLLARPDVRPRKWHETEVRAGYFTVKRWVPRDQDHLTKELHGGLTDKGDIAAAAKFLMRGARGGLRANRRSSRGMVTPTPASRGKGTHSGGGARSLTTPENKTGAGTLGGGGWDSQEHASAPPSAPVPPPDPPTAPMPGRYYETTADMGAASGRAKRPASAIDAELMESEPPLQTQRLSDEANSRQSEASWSNQAAGVTPGSQLGNEALSHGRGGEGMGMGGVGMPGDGAEVGGIWEEESTPI